MGTESETYQLGILGAGVMGSGIAALAVGHGVPVVLMDTDPQALERARAAVAHQVRHAGLVAALPAGVPRGELVLSTSPEDLAGVTAVVEAVTEDFAAKAKALATAAEAVTPGTPLLTNTSGIPVDELADGLPRPGDVIGTHFMNPPYLIKMVEVSRGPRTADTTLAATERLLTGLARQPVVIRDAPGFVTSRLLHPMINDAIRVVAEGTASAEAVDQLMRGCLGHPTGPLRTADLIGLDNLADALTALHLRTGDERSKPCVLLLEKVRAGDLGRKTGRGFYDYGEGLK
ncbi:3-hydroxyacyl-CoA dehydrogenase family protein [Streptomyces caeruleatus]|uniref:3-hydroxyacyl-CoA dehydrogenase n=1 Tax=Streptomyces caeruleatus TaxID=661399 RepID=A0A124I5T2_9ACTN|nr:3-hydroxyacyl-CoA dehydrogenase family protein [Streptomyces caeruleatus]KUN90914.1 3-hydroxyacyl-CoA dehydrogenase [Streptomyces caeruleatus]